MSGLGSETWMGADEAGDPELHARATAFLAAIKWESLVALAYSMRGAGCQLSEKFSMGHFNVVRRLTFEDGASWAVRLRLPDLQSVFGTREALNAEGCMGVEVATMKHIRAKTNIPVPEVFGYNLDADNEIGAPYILMEYLHGTVASELQEQRGCESHVFGTVEQDARFWRQMATIHVQLASLTSDQIGSLRQDQNTFAIGPEIETGNGPRKTSRDYYSALAHHRLQVAEKDADEEVRNSDSFALPRKFSELIEELQQKGQAQNTGPYAMANRDFGAHNIIVDDEFNIVGLIDFDGCIFAPMEVAAQFPAFTGVERPIPEHVETRPAALERMEEVRHLAPRYVDLVRTATTELESSSTTGSSVSLADALVSGAASVVHGLNEYGCHQDFVNDRWMVAYALLAEKKDPRPWSNRGSLQNYANGRL